jgi:hypothetical protein
MEKVAMAAMLGWPWRLKQTCLSCCLRHLQLQPPWRLKWLGTKARTLGRRAREVACKAKTLKSGVARTGGGWRGEERRKHQSCRMPQLQQRLEGEVP